LIDSSIRISKKAYRYVFLVQNRNYWNACPFEYDKSKDIVLSFDFAVVNMVKLAGGEAQYIDHIVSSEILEKYNYKTYEFFAAWHYNIAKDDIFSYQGIEIGSAFRIEIWNDITFYVRIFVNVYELFKRIKYELIYIGIDDHVVADIFESLNITTIKWSNNEDKQAVEYYFPIFNWMEESLHPNNIKHNVKGVILKIFSKIFNIIDKFKYKIKKMKYVYIERYHPTNDIISELKKANNIRMIRSDFNSIADMFSGAHLPVYVSCGDAHHNYQAKKILEKFETEKCAALFVDDIDISKDIYKLIIKRISPLIAKSLKIVDIIIKVFSSRQLDLMVTFSSIGVINRLMINYCKNNNIPIYMIINGLLANSFLDEAKEGTWINSYSKSIKKNYFKGMDNIVCLGDPRMDKYSNCHRERPIDYSKPTIGIGASGFTNVDLNCYLSIEFEFLNDIMKSCQRLKKMGKDMDIIIKIRSNGYIQQYKHFLDEYFPDMSVNLVDAVPIQEVYAKVDFFISIYSQTLFEASHLGIPVLYYKNDTQFFHPPFDGDSELVTAFTLEDLVSKIEAFYNRDKIYDAFKREEIMEKYIGTIDGQNLKRNMDFIYSLM